MTGMVFIERAGLAGSALQQWVRDAAGYVRSLPPRQPRPAAGERQ